MQGIVFSLPRRLPRYRRALVAAESLEPRCLLAAHLGYDPPPQLTEVTEIRAESCAADHAESSGTTTVLAAATAQTGRHALSAVPVLHSLAGADATLYLDFNGHTESNWGEYGAVRAPAFDLDGNANRFSDQELDAIRDIWRRVAEDYAPLNIDVTTESPSSFANRKALRVAIGGNGSWTGGTHGGLGYVDSFTNDIPNTVFVFSENLAGGNSRYVADAAAHEAGHALGLQHQAKYASNGNKVQGYSTGHGDGRAPLMGSSYQADRSLWWQGSTTSSKAHQDDLSVLASSVNGFGFRADDHGDSAAGATDLETSGNDFSVQGVIGGSSDRDAFAFQTAAGRVRFTVSVLEDGNNLDARLELQDADGNVLASASPADDFNATISTTLAAGSYRLVVASSGGYGNAGYYRLHGTLAATVARSATTGLGTTVVVDNRDRGFSRSGSWSESAATGEHRGSSLGTTQVGAAARWTPTLPLAGTYQVWAWWTAASATGGRYDRDSAADYTVHHTDGVSRAVIDQDRSAGRWNLLGTFAFDAGDSNYVRLVRDSANGVGTIADAVKFVYQSPQQSVTARAAEVPPSASALPQTATAQSLTPRASKMATALEQLAAWSEATRASRDQQRLAELHDRAIEQLTRLT